MKTCFFFLTLITLMFLAPEGQTRRTHVTPEQRSQLEKAQVIFVTTLALTEDGRADATPIQTIVTERLKAIGFAIVTDRAKPHDVQFKVKCEERKTWTGTTPFGGDAELSDAPARLWKGPACLFTYFLNGKNLGWYKEVRTPFEDAIGASKIAGAENSGAYALEQLAHRVTVFDFPVLITAEWGQADRLLKLLNSPNTPKLRKLKILSVLHELQADEALPHLTEIMKEKDLNQEAIVALAGVGPDSIPVLIDLFQTSQQDEIRAAAAKALGDVAGRSGDPTALPPLQAYLKNTLKNLKTSEDINFPVLTQVVWALGKLLDDSSIEPMAKLNEKVWLIYDNSPEMKELREAANWTYKQLDLTQFAT